MNDPASEGGRFDVVCQNSLSLCRSSRYSDMAAVVGIRLPAGGGQRPHRIAGGVGLAARAFADEVVFAIAVEKLGDERQLLAQLFLVDRKTVLASRRESEDRRPLIVAGKAGPIFPVPHGPGHQQRQRFFDCGPQRGRETAASSAPCLWRWKEKEATIRTEKRNIGIGSFAQTSQYTPGTFSTKYSVHGTL